MIKENSTVWSWIVLATGTAAVVLACSAQAEPPGDDKIQALAKRTKEQLILVKGGEFLMGDFGEIDGAEKLPYSSASDDGPLHRVVLSDYFIGKYKVTLGDYDLYATATGQPMLYRSSNQTAGDKKVRAHPKSPTFPAGVDWADAKRYCQWIGGKIGHQMDLPTEAEWEFAARGRGKLLIFATDNGTEDRGRNFATLEQNEEVTGTDAGDMPVGLYPPNPIGLHDMASNGFEWTDDWYAADYYARSPVNNPTGPQLGSKKVLRSLPNGESHPAMTFQRRSREPAIAQSTMGITNRGYGFRCVAR